MLNKHLINGESSKQTIQLHLCTTTHFSKAALGGTRTHNTLQSRQSALPTELATRADQQAGPKLSSSAELHTRRSPCVV